MTHEGVRWYRTKNHTVTRWNRKLIAQIADYTYYHFECQLECCSYTFLIVVRQNKKQKLKGGISVVEESNLFLMIMHQHIILKRAKIAAQVSKLQRFYFSLILTTYSKSMPIYHNEMSFYAAIPEHILEKCEAVA